MSADQAQLAYQKLHERTPGVECVRRRDYAQAAAWRAMMGGAGRLPVYLVIAVTLATLLARTVNLEADLPTGLAAETDYGIYVDEGYKTLSARNLILFGRSPWHADDHYPGWAAASPLTHQTFHWAFDTFGVSLGTARIVAILWFALLLLGYSLAYGRAPAAVWAGGLLMLGFEHLMWLFSRTALLEIAGAGLMWGVLLASGRFTRRVLPTALLVLSVGMLAHWGIKQNAAALFVPMLFGLALQGAVHSGRLAQFTWACAIAAIAGILPKVAVQFGYELPLYSLMQRADLFPPLPIVERYLANPLLQADPLLIVLGHAAALGLVLHRPAFLFARPYRVAILSAALSGMGMLALVPNVRLRYCVLLLPAYILVVVEWWLAQRQGSEEPEPAPAALRFVPYAGLGILVTLVYGVLHLTAAVAGLAVPGPDEGGAAFFRMLLLAMALAALAWRWRAVVLAERSLRSFGMVVLAGLLVFNGYKVAGYVLSPTWHARSIASELASILPHDAVVAGDWSSFLGLGTRLRMLHMNYEFNRPERITVLRPSFFLHVETDAGREFMQRLQTVKGVSLGAPLFRGEYAGVGVILYPVQYDSGERDALDVAASRGAGASGGGLGPLKRTIQRRGSA